MKPSLLVLGLALALAVTARAATFVATLDGAQVSPPHVTTGAGGAVLQVDLVTRGWSLSGEISNLVFSATLASIHGPAPTGRNADPLASLGHNVEPDGPLDGAGVFTEEELQWLQQGLLYVTVFTDAGRFPEGEIRGQLVPVPEPGAWGLLAGAGLAVVAVRQRVRRSPGAGIAGRR